MEKQTGHRIKIIVIDRGGEYVSNEFLIKQGESKYILDVYHVKGMQHNLLSIGKLRQKGYRVYMEDDHCVIKDKCPSD